MTKTLIFPVIFFFLHTSPPLIENKNTIENNDDKIEIYLIKQRWHTAIVFQTEYVDTTIFPEAKLFEKYELIDIGWGDAEFYQHPGFDSGLALRALFLKTPSTLRVEGIVVSKESYFEISEIVVRLDISDKQLEEIIEFISNTIFRTEDSKPIVLSEAGLGRIIFFLANGDYYLFNTCNTWLASCLSGAGINIRKHLILTEELFNDAAQIGTVLKAEN
jgi:uncharacterized protein (TIGR02117 family)